MNVYEVRVTIKSEVPVLAADWVCETLGHAFPDYEAKEYEVELISEEQGEDYRGAERENNR